MAGLAPQLIGESAPFLVLLDWVSDLASLDIPVLIMGERGTGKAQIAMRLHFLSQRWEQTYHTVNCAAYDDDAFEDLMYLGETNTPILEQVDGGTLYLDNVDRLSRHAQERFLQVIEYGEFNSGDGRGTQAVDIRFITSMSGRVSASNIYEYVSHDFLDRIASDVIHIPPLRVRPDDIAPLMLHFGRKCVSKLGAEKFPGVTPEALEQLTRHSWPGNVRELKNVIDRATARAFLQDETLSTPLSEMTLELLQTPWQSMPAANNAPADIGQSQNFVSAHASAQAGNFQGHLSEDVPTVDQAMDVDTRTTDFNDRVMVFERGLIDEAMQVADHHQGKAAAYLNLTYHQFRGLLRKHGLKK